MDIRRQLQLEIDNLQGQISALKEKGPFLQGVRLERTAAGGTASLEAKESCKYARLRAGKGKLLDNGKKSKYIPVHEIEKYETMCARGKAIGRLEREVLKKEQGLKRIEAIAASLQLK
ncbi:hypothetical protein [cf. Phormidesmis sp. LEGE 11477]|uniref:hypothetical protein n=1 Tax=cf. Phormidesmis sp. LEGE 11477 TaxID=1828680 RepID=UPI00187FAE0A|nr:hypothetical protein [cf. Phormidesmis sp. LEGE 11477]MBE9064848.1 hypothetical protein [cf. Phormidesmis sp. LEGE 11477]